MKEIFVYGEIGWEVTAEGLREQLEAADGEDVTLRIHSRGGDVMEGVAMMTALQRYEGRVTGTIDGLAASMAANLAMVCEHLSMPENAWIMFHEANSSTWGAEADDLERMAEILRAMNEGIVDILVDRTGEDAEALREELKGEMWMTGRQAQERGIVHSVTKAIAMAAHVPAGVFARVPERLRKVDSEERAMSKDAKFSWLDRLGKKPEQELERVAAERAEEQSELEQFRALLGEEGPVHKAFASLEGRIEALSTENAERRKDQATLAALVEKMTKGFEEAVKNKAAQEVLDQAAAQGVVLRSAPLAEEAPKGEEPEEELTPGERWAAMPEGAERRKYFQENKREILRTVRPWVSN